MEKIRDTQGINVTNWYRPIPIRKPGIRKSFESKRNIIRQLLSKGFNSEEIAWFLVGDKRKLEEFLINELSTPIP